LFQVVLAALLAASRTFCTAGRRRPIKTAMMAITTNNSISVNAFLDGGRGSKRDFDTGHLLSARTAWMRENTKTNAADVRQERGPLGCGWFSRSRTANRRSTCLETSAPTRIGWPTVWAEPQPGCHPFLYKLPGTVSTTFPSIRGEEESFYPFPSRSRASVNKKREGQGGRRLGPLADVIRGLPLTCGGRPRRNLRIAVACGHCPSRRTAVPAGRRPGPTRRDRNCVCRRGDNRPDQPCATASDDG
jgi:hypothetical protein